MFKNLLVYDLCGGNMVEKTNEMTERLFEAFRLAMNIAMNITDESWNEDVGRFIETTHKLVLRIANDIARAMELMEKQYGIKIPEEIWKEMEELDEEYKKL